MHSQGYNKFMLIKTALTILFCSLLLSCADPGEEYVTVKGITSGTEVVVKIKDEKWVDTYKGWGCRMGAYRITNPEDAKKVDAYKNQ